MLQWYIRRMREYGALAARFRRGYGDLVDQQTTRAMAEIDAAPVDDEEKERLRRWVQGVREREYQARVPVERIRP